MTLPICRLATPMPTR
uniref:Uncharacterized protein n=1 Tax=Arundo donax TaxID=35708 RepID=A0A0A9GMW8_ARUDO